MAKLKVFRTAIGFHDAYVAASSQKAALAAWGSDADLFARGVAEVVDDPALAAEPLARPGEVVKRLRGTAAEQLAALPPDRPKAPAAPVAEPEPDVTTRRPPKPPLKPKPKPKPLRPDRATLDTAEQALADAAARQRTEDATLAAEERALAERRRLQHAAHARETAQLEAARDRAQAGFDAAMARWRTG